VAQFVRSVVIDAPLETVFGFHERPDALQLLAPAFPPMRVVSKSGGIETGAQVEMRVGGVLWIALHTAYRRNSLFVDEQIEGPFAKWVHHHEFEDLGGRTRLTGRVEFRLPGGLLANAVLAWTVKLGLIQMFRNRHRVTKHFCEKH